MLSGAVGLGPSTPPTGRRLHTRGCRSLLLSCRVRITRSENTSYLKETDYKEADGSCCLF